MFSYSGAKGGVVFKDRKHNEAISTEVAQAAALISIAEQLENLVASLDDVRDRLSGLEDQLGAKRNAA
jgi:hypothetical protein